MDALRAEVPGDALIGDGVLELCRLSDIVFPALHGGMGEDGSIQATLSSMGIPYTGSDFAACLVAMDKSLSKLLFRAHACCVSSLILLCGLHIRPKACVIENQDFLSHKIKKFFWKSEI